MVSILSEWFLICPNGFYSVRTVSILSGRFQFCPDGFNTVRTVSILFGWFQFCPDSFNSVWMVSILSGRCQIINKWSQCNVNDVCATCTHYLKLHSMMIHFCAFLCVACEDNALVSCRERVMRFFYMLRERITRFFDVSRKMDPRALSGKFLRVKSCYPESFRFLGLCTNATDALMR